MRTVLVFLTMFFLPAGAQAQTLWQNVNFGMDIAEVLSAQPDAVATKSADTLSNGAACNLNIPSYEVAGHNYRVCFFFKNDQLLQVTLTALETAHMGQFQALTTLLRAKYGQEISNDENILGRQVEWQAESGVNISLLYISKFSNLMNINYQVRLAEEKGKL